MTRPRVLVSTLRPANGGVAAKARWLCGRLDQAGYTPVLAWYEPWSLSPRLSVPAHALPRGRRPGQRHELAFGQYEGHAIGAWLPELEFTHYLPTRPWRQLIAGCQHHVAVSGNPLCAAPLALSPVPFLLWVGSPWQDDRIDRVRRFPWPRRLLDQVVNTPVLRRLERRILRSPQGRILSISHHTERALAALAGRPLHGVMRLPVAGCFTPKPESVRPWRLGFSGRYGDPRKHIDLLLAAVARLTRAGQPVRLELTGEPDPAFLHPRLAALGIADHVHCHPRLEPAGLAAVLQGLDLFVIPSHQEGLCIAAVEAMACGVPVLSTRCGGSDDFVIPGETGAFTAAEPAAMAAAITAICADRACREHLALGAAAWAGQHVDEQAAAAVLGHHWHQLYPSASPL